MATMKSSIKQKFFFSFFSKKTFNSKTAKTSLIMGLKLSRHYPIVHQFDQDAIQEKNPYYVVFATGIQGWRPSTVG
jgi:hypothetical protein